MLFESIILPHDISTRGLYIKSCDKLVHQLREGLISHSQYEKKLKNTTSKYINSNGK